MLKGKDIESKFRKPEEVPTTTICLKVIRAMMNTGPVRLSMSQKPSRIHLMDGVRGSEMVYGDADGLGLGGTRRAMHKRGRALSTFEN